MAIFATYQGSNQGSLAFVCSRNSGTNGHVRKDVSVTAENGGLKVKYVKGEQGTKRIDCPECSQTAAAV